MGGNKILASGISLSGSKAKDVERERKKGRLKLGNNNGQLRIACIASKPPGPIPHRELEILHLMSLELSCLNKEKKMK